MLHITIMLAKKANIRRSSLPSKPSVRPKTRTPTEHAQPYVPHGFCDYSTLRKLTERYVNLLRTQNWWCTTDAILKRQKRFLAFR